MKIFQKMQYEYIRKHGPQNFEINRQYSYPFSYTCPFPNLRSVSPPSIITTLRIFLSLSHSSLLQTAW
jgi:hypothetical protein